MKTTGSSRPVILFKYFRYRMIAGSKRGRGIHSPFIYDFARKVLYNEDRIRVPNEVKNIHLVLKKDRTLLEAGHFGAGSRITRSTRRSVRSFARHSSLHPRYGRLLFRLVHWYTPDAILELGTGLGVSTLYLSEGFPGAMVTVEGSAERLEYAKRVAGPARVSRIDFFRGLFEEGIAYAEPLLGRRMLVYLDGDHTYEATTRMVKMLIEKSGGAEMAIVVDDIHWSAGMERAWNVCRELHGVRFSVDLFRVGILFLNEETGRQHFTITF